MHEPRKPGAQPAVTLFRLDGCPGAADLRTLFDGLGVAYVEVLLGRPATPGDACGYTSPTVHIASGPRKPEVLVQPSREEVLGALGGGRRRREG